MRAANSRLVRPRPTHTQSSGDSPVLELVDYLNQRGIETGPLEPGMAGTEGNRDVFSMERGAVRATVGAFQLASRFDTIIDPASPTPGSGGLLARLDARLVGGRHITRAAFLALHAKSPGIVAVDRLCRTLHMLNFLGSHDAHTDTLWLEVSLQHVLAVEDDHGHFLETLLYRCGIAQTQVVLIIPVLPRSDRDFSRLRTALASYRRRGHPLALDLRGTQPPIVAGACALLAPEWLYVTPRQAADGSLPRAPRLLLHDITGMPQEVLCGPRCARVVVGADTGA